jgi:hypothetical protein
MFTTPVLCWGRAAHAVLRPAYGLIEEHALGHGIDYSDALSFVYVSGAVLSRRSLLHAVHGFVRVRSTRQREAL